MGRSKGDATRSKARASSSSLAASLLQTPVPAAVGFGGYSGSARVDVPSSVDGEHLQDVDGDAFLLLKRLSKKDPTTKLKALVALRVFFEERPGSEVSALISPWLFEYKRLVQDSSRQVRQATHLAMTSFATCVGRGLAPYLRSLMGPWWVAQFDPSREISEAAKDSFQVAFSGQKKRLEALIFCEKEIFSHLDENLKLTPQTISDKATPIEESTEKYERVVSCSLLASAALLDVLIGSVYGRSDQGNTADSDNGEAMSSTKARITEEVRKLCWNHKFLQQFLISKASRIRSAAYQALRAFIQHLPEVFREEDMDVIVSSILGTFAEKDPACHQHMWDMVLLFTKAFPLSWDTAAVKRTVFPRLWSFLQHGCYGSQQISYPYFIVLISLLPPKAVLSSQNFLLKLFSKMWQGQSAPQFGPADCTALLKAVQECLIWSVLNAKRFSDPEGYEAIDLQIALIDGVLVKLLWHDYIGDQSEKLSLAISTIDPSPSSDLSGPTVANKASGLSVGRVPSKQFKQQLGSCIVLTIQLLSGHVDEIMGTFWNEFHGWCFRIIVEAGTLWQSKKEEDLRIARMEEFFMVLGRKTSNGEDREQWALSHSIRPFVAKSFASIRSLGHPGSIRLMAALTSKYGPTVFSLLTASQTQKDKTDEEHVRDSEDNEDMLQFFKNDIVPWCLAGDENLNGPKAELVLAFIESINFQGEWEFVISHVTVWQDDMDSVVDLRQVDVLATLLEKLMERKNTLYMNKEPELKGNDTSADWWKSPRIDRAAVRVASGNHLSHPGCLRLLRSALGGTSSDKNQFGIVSDKAAGQILNSLLLRMLKVLSASVTKWIRSAPSLIMDSGVTDLSNVSKHDEDTDRDLQLAVSAVNILRDSIFSLLSLDRDHTISGKLLAAIFCLKWACSMLDHSGYDNGYDPTKDSDTDLEDSEEEDIGFDVSSTLESSLMETVIDDSYVSSGALEAEPSSELEQDWSGLRESLFSVWQKTTPQFCQRFSALTRFGLRQILMKCLRVAVLHEESETAEQMARRCAAWAQEVVGYVCDSREEVSEFVDSLLASADSWPLWVVAPSAKSDQSGRYLPSWDVQENITDIKIQRHGRFAAFVDHLCRTLGQEEIFWNSLGVEVSMEDNALESLGGGSNIFCGSCRIWLVCELLCTWEWPGGSAHSEILPYLWSFARLPESSIEFGLLWGTIKGLFIGSTNSRGSKLNTSASARDDDRTSTKEPFLRALLMLLKGLLEKEDGWSISDARALFHLHVTSQEAVDFVSPICDVEILPRVLAVLMPILRKRSIEPADADSEEEWQAFLQTAVSLWVKKAMSGPPLVAIESDSEISGYQWVQIVVACFPLNPAGGAAAMASASSVPVTSQERDLLLALLRKQYSYEAIRAVAASAAAVRISQVKLSESTEKKQGVEVTLAKLVAVALGYCWLSFGSEEWDFILKKVRGWLQEAVLEAEEFTEAVVDIVKMSPEMPELEFADSVMTALENVIAEKTNDSVELYSMAVAIFSLLRGLDSLEKVDSTDAVAKLKDANWQTFEVRVLEDVLRLLLSMGLAESGAVTSSAGESGATLIASQRKLQGQLWDNVADVALGASNHARQAAIRAVDLWGVGKGAISSLYALLLSPQPTSCLQWVAYEFLSTPEILPMAISYGIVIGSSETDTTIEGGSIDGSDMKDEGEVKVEDVKGEDSQGLPLSQIAQIRPELVSTIEIAPSVILRSPLTSTIRVSYLLGWSLLLTRLQSLTAMTRTRELLVQYIQDADISPALLDCLFQYIPLEQKLGTTGSRRKNRSATVTTSSAAASATRATASGSVAFAVEGLWPVQKEGLVTLAGAIYGVMLLVLPACVRSWFTGLRDKSLASAIEAFTTTHCSPQLFADEFAQVQASAVNEENLSIRSNRTLREVTAIYQKEEAGMDVVIRIPSCYPLRAVDVECTRRLGINETLLRKWILSMAAFLRNQNGAVAEAVQMWKKNVDREFEGVEECPICYSIIHTSNHSLPRLACKTCRHKFHSACLYKWFSTSHQSLCPLCKSPF